MTAPRLRRQQSYEEALARVRQAIENKQSLTAVYHDRRRLFCPYLLGTNDSGRVQVLCYQFGGESATGLHGRNSPDDWRCIAVESLHEVEFSQEHWRSPENRYRPQTCIKHIESAVEGWPVADEEL